MARSELSPIFCEECGNRIGWAEDAQSCELGYMFCEDCAKKPKTEDEDTDGQDEVGKTGAY
jgi:hypothetical protein